MTVGRWMSLGLVFVAIASGTTLFAATKQYIVQKDAQAVAVATMTFNAMGGLDALAAYQDCTFSGTATIYGGQTPLVYPITVKSKGLREVRVETEKPKGTSVRITNGGQAVIITPDGSVKDLDPNNTFDEFVDHVPLLSVLAEYATGSVNLIYQGVQKLQDQTDDVIEIDYVPTLDPVQGKIFASMSRTLYFVNQTTRLVDKTQTTRFYEGDTNNTFTEEVYYSDYRLTNGLTVPFYQSIFTDSVRSGDVTFTSVNFNQGLPDSDFALPKGR